MSCMWQKLNFSNQCYKSPPSSPTHNAIAHLFIQADLCFMLMYAWVQHQLASAVSVFLIQSLLFSALLRFEFASGGNLLPGVHYFPRLVQFVESKM